MAMYHVLDVFGVEVHKSEDRAQAHRAADQARAIKLNGCTVFNVEKREHVYTTQTLDEAVKGTSADPSYTAPAN